MPIYEWRCARDGYKTEKLMSYEKSQSVEVICPHCSDAMLKMVSMPAKTADAWHGGWTDGLQSSYFSTALGRRVANRREEAKILESRGFVAESDLGKDWIENKQAGCNCHRPCTAYTGGKKKNLFQCTIRGATGPAFPACHNGICTRWGHGPCFPC